MTQPNTKSPSSAEDWLRNNEPLDNLHTDLIDLIHFWTTELEDSRHYINGHPIWSDEYMQGNLDALNLVLIELSKAGRGVNS